MTLPAIECWVALHPEMSQGVALLDDAAVTSWSEAVEQDLGGWRYFFKRRRDRARWRVLRQTLRRRLDEEVEREIAKRHSLYEESIRWLANFLRRPDAFRRLLLEFESIWRPRLFEEISLSWVAEAPAATFVNDVVSMAFYHAAFMPVEWHYIGYGVYVCSFTKSSEMGGTPARQQEFEKRTNAFGGKKDFAMISYYQAFDKRAYAAFDEAYAYCESFSETLLFDPLGYVPPDIKRDLTLDSKIWRDLADDVSPWSYESVVRTASSLLIDVMAEIVDERRKSIERGNILQERALRV